MIIKAELLWTRKCSLNCSYCNMKQDKGNSRSLYDWIQIIDNLKKLDCQFIAIYGAEPLEDMDKLPQVIQYITENNIDCTVITSMNIKHARDKLDLLYEYGLRSLSTSYDISGNDKSSTFKTQNGLRLLQYFQKFQNIQNVAAITTVTKKNVNSLFNAAKFLSDLGIWFFFDIIHPNRNQPGSKCKGSVIDLLLTKEDRNTLLNQLQLLNTHRNELLIHNSEIFMNLIKNNPNLIIDFSWNCAYDNNFPSWVTIDCDGMVYPCDDYQHEKIAFDALYLFQNWQLISETWREDVKKNCPGCAWNTHIDSHAIKNKTLSIDLYVHK